MNNDVSSYAKSVFERIRHVDEHGKEFWYARELAKILDYNDFRNFDVVVQKAVQACQSSGENVSYHLVEATEMIEIGRGGKRALPSYRLSRYACYLIVQNADPSKEMVALGQTYFAIQTRRQELRDETDQLSENELRLKVREQVRKHNKQLVDAAKDAGVETHQDYAVFQDEGYKGLYGGLNNKGIHQRKDLKKSQKILD